MTRGTTEEFYRLAVLGHPIAQSKSPFIHTHWLALNRLAGSYVARDVPPDALGEHVSQLVREGYKGWKITLPHKEQMHALCDVLDASAQAIGAVNTVRVLEDGRLQGFNTDAGGWWDSIAPSLPAKPRTALVLGAGGAARAIMFALQQQGITTYICNRTHDRAAQLAAQFSATPVSWERAEELLPEMDLLVNTTSLGMAGQSPLVFDLQGLQSHTLVSDLIYKPAMTPLLNAAQAKGCQAVNGLGMLLGQAARAFQIWTGVQPEIDAHLIEALQG